MTRPEACFIVFALGGSLLASVGVGCGGSPSEPSPPPRTQTPPPSPSPPSTYTVNGRVVGTVTGEPIAGATVTVGAERFTTDGDGNFTLSSTTPNTRDLVISGAGLLTRESRLSVANRSATVDVIQIKPPFDLTFFQRFARNALETENGLEPLRPLRAAPRIHIRTVDEKGLPIDSRTINLVEDALRDAAPGWSDGRFPLEVVERGSGTRQGQEGWITVLWPNPGDDGVCGRATIGTTTGFIELHYRNEACACGSRFVSPVTVRHELGHVYGYWHTNSSRDVMFGAVKVCTQQQSAREIAHAKYMYSRPAGNQDPDTDPSGTTLRTPPVIVIDN